MNIFYLHHDPLICAKMHCDKHVVKMILEYSQLLSTAHHECDGVPSITCYKATHKNHPSALWARENSYNYNWLHTLLWYLSEEYTYRYRKVHLTKRKGIIDDLCNTPYELPEGVSNTPVPQCMPIHYKKDGDSIEAYREYYAGDKAYMARWTERDVPVWYTTKIREAEMKGIEDGYSSNINILNSRNRSISR